MVNAAFPLLALSVLAAAHPAHAPQLNLPAVLAKRAARFTHSVRKGALTTEAKGCDALQEASSLAEQLQGRLQQRWLALDGDDLPAYYGAITRLDAALPGISFQVSNETVTAFLDLRELSSRWPGRGGSPLLKAVGALGPLPSPTFHRRISEHEVCVDLASARGPAETLARLWPKAPACVRTLVGPSMEALLARSAEVSCFCSSEEQARLDAARFASSIAELGPAGRQAALTLRAQLGAKDVRFNCAPEGS